MAKSVTAPYIVLEEFNQFLVPSWKNPADGKDPFDGGYLDSFTPTSRLELAVTFEIKVSMVWSVLKLAQGQNSPCQLPSSAPRRAGLSPHPTSR